MPLLPQQLPSASEYTLRAWLTAEIGNLTSTVISGEYEAVHGNPAIIVSLCKGSQIEHGYDAYKRGIDVTVVADNGSTFEQHRQWVFEALLALKQSDSDWQLTGWSSTTSDKVIMCIFNMEHVA